MITSDTITWLHLPKTGGTSTAQLFRKLNLPGISVDPDDEDAKHESISSRLGQIKPNPTSTTIITSRRLASWLLSDWHHKTVKMGLSLPFNPVKSGLFYSLRLGGTWVAADYWIHYFKANECDRVVRLENLEEDANQHVLPLLPSNTPSLSFPAKNINFYSRDLESFFGSKDLKRIYDNNPAWTAWENTIYGNLASIKSIKRLKAAIKKRSISALKPSAQF